MRMFVAALLLVFAPLRATASCDPGAPPSYGDITYVKVHQGSLVGQQWPRYTYEAAYYRRGQHGPHATASIDARRATRLRGTFVAVDAIRTFHATIAVLKRDAFFSMRLQPAKSLYLDGPDDAVTVVRCGVTTTLGTAARSDEMDLGDAQAKAFFALEADLRRVIFAQQWETPPPNP